MFGLVPTAGVLVTFGALILVTLGVQMLIGYRKIHFKGRTHLRVHKTVAWVLLGLGIIHGTFALMFVGYLRL